ncbi:DUF1254 domain-containing protein [Mycobacterium vicinigordonae]|uniref:DUF1254 domain-containing protein n=2 Tax=Mycobacterium vicinigordonae TaxID=1719132 RepID=A0A7D6EDU0_9MYCO|nr:DUF1254 domain-containing protein [Mycobacterium vicinigordonae]
MTTLVASALAMLSAGTLAACGHGGRVRPDPSRTAQARLREKAKDAYIFTYGLVMNYRTMYKQAIEGDREFGRWLNLGTSTPTDKDIVTPNNDTPYSYAWADLRAEPWVLTLPKVDSTRYIVSQWDDLWGFVLDNPGSVLDGNNGISVLIAPPDWNGQLPQGVSRAIRGESQFLGTLTRTELTGTDDGTEQVKAIQREYKLEPLSAFQHTTAPAPAPSLNWPAWTEGDEMTTKYWDYVSLLLPFTTDNPVDQPMYDNLAALGITRGRPFAQDTLSQEVKDALKGGIQDAQAALKKCSQQKDLRSGDLFGDRAKLGTHYFDRALGVYMGIFGNVPQQSMYYTLPLDQTGVPLDGSKGNYSITFPPGQTPAVDYFWSLTMYSVPDRLLVANPLNRYSIGSSTPGLQANPDGSLTVYFTARDPGGDKTSNWLPAPEGPFWVVLRTYGPKPAMVDGSWQPPTTKKIS